MEAVVVNALRDALRRAETGGSQPASAKHFKGERLQSGEIGGQIGLDRDEESQTHRQPTVDADRLTRDVGTFLRKKQGTD